MLYRIRACGGNTTMFLCLMRRIGLMILVRAARKVLDSCRCSFQKSFLYHETALLDGFSFLVLFICFKCWPTEMHSMRSLAEVDLMQS